jgi:hypothetical protein
MRGFIRHSSDFPVVVEVIGESASRRGLLRDVSVAGLSFDVASEITVGSKINYYVPSLSDEPAGRGQVVWCRSMGAGYRLGVEFESEQDAYRMRMVEQVCQIENYRREVKKFEGRELDSEEAAVEWIGAYAADFNRRFS